jgi:flagellar basal body-associated protein FliL
MKTNKKGISLIVLVITIIVMIILATAIILSLNSSNISGKATEAKLSSDLANKKEASAFAFASFVYLGLQ